MPNSNDFESSLRQRLNTLAREHPQAEIARKTGVSPANVNRYLKQNRIPASFCAALVKGLGVNPAWLLAGEGTPKLADVASGNEKLAGNLLELVQAMDSVATMRLGSLAGKRGLAVLRELNDNLSRHEKLKAKLNEHTREIFAQVLSDWKAALDASHEERAGALRKAAEQVSRLCEDRRLELEYLALLARHHFMFDSLAKSLEIRRRLLLHLLGEELDEAAFNEARLLVNALESVGRSEEAERVARAVNTLAEKQGPRFAQWPQLLASHGLQLIALRDLDSACAKLLEARRAGARDGVLLYLHVCYFYMGTMGLAEFRQAAPQGEDRADLAVRMALFIEEPQALMATAQDYDKAREGATTTGRIEPEIARLLQRAITRRDKRAYDEYWRVVAAAPFLSIQHLPWNISLRVWASRIALHARRKEAIAMLRESDAELQAFPPELRLPILIEAAHHRNVLEQVPENERDRELAAMRMRAETFFREHLSRGYGCLAPAARKHGIITVAP